MGNRYIEKALSGAGAGLAQVGEIYMKEQVLAERDARLQAYRESDAATAGAAAAATTAAEQEYKTNERVSGQEFASGERAAGEEFKAKEGVLDRQATIEANAARAGAQQGNRVVGGSLVDAEGNPFEIPLTNTKRELYIDETIKAKMADRTRLLASAAVHESSLETPEQIKTSTRADIIARFPVRGDKSAPNKNPVPATAPKAALDALKKDPSLAKQFQAKYGYLPK